MYPSDPEFPNPYNTEKTSTKEIANIIGYVAERLETKIDERFDRLETFILKQIDRVIEESNNNRKELERHTEVCAEEIYYAIPDTDDYHCD